MRRKKQVRCKSDLHFYDADEHHACPYCARPVREARRTPESVAIDVAPAAIPDTQVSWSDEKSAAPRVPPSDSGDGTLGYWAQRDDGEPAAFARQLRPVVGWLVCTEGPARYRDHPLFMGRNTLGRDAGNDVVVRGDKAISRRKQAVITFEPESRVFFITEGEGVNPTYLNGEALREAVDLSRHDKVRIGKTTLLFVPLCGDDFQWEAS